MNLEDACWCRVRKGQSSGMGMTRQRKTFTKIRQASVCVCVHACACVLLSFGQFRQRCHEVDPQRSHFSEQLGRERLLKVGWVGGREEAD